ncbi:MAG: Xaa-Pro dipeptidase [Pseudohongiellaceae bacterium]
MANEAGTFGAHIQRLQSIYTDALSVLDDDSTKADSVLVHSGSEVYYYADDQTVPFVAYGHFMHWLPVNRPDQFIWFRPGMRPVYLQVILEDFWHDQSIENESWWADQFELVRLSAVDGVKEHLEQHGSGGRIAYLGPNTELAGELGVAESLTGLPLLSYYLDFHRAVKSAYELEQLREANVQSLPGHAAAREIFLDGGNEFEVHQAFLTACNITARESPYNNIVGIDEKAAILHYQYKRRNSAADSKVLLIDAGCRVNNYCSDITRTTVKDSTHTVFKSLLAAMDSLQLSLVELVKPGMAYKELHDAAIVGIADILLAHDLCYGSREQLVDDGTAKLFMPHGIGHLLGVQVHDVGGHQKDSTGLQEDPPEDAPSLRNTRIMEEDMVFTVEPGLYFIPMLLEPKLEESRDVFNAALIGEMYPLGGIRIEDDVRVRGAGVENFTRV